MFSSKTLITMMAAGGLMLASQQAGAVLVPTAQDDALFNVGDLLGQTNHFEGGGGYIYEATADTDGNLFAAMGVADDVGFSGWAHHVDVNAVKAANGFALTEGMALRMSGWVMSNPNNPFTGALAEDGFRMEFLNLAGGSGLPGSPDLILTTPLTPVGGAPLLTTGWTQKSFTFELSNNIANTNNYVDFANLAEIRPVMAEAGGVGAGGEIFADNFVLEAFSSVAAANAMPLPGQIGGESGCAACAVPGAFDVPIPVDLRGDANGDGFVGVDDLNLVLVNWNATPPPPTLSPVQISDFSSPFALDGTYVDWDTAVFTDGASDFRVESVSNSGGGFLTLASPLDATGMGELEIQLDVNAANVASAFNVVLIDADGTERVIRYADLVVGDNQTLTVDLDDFLQDNAPGTVEGLDLSTITTFHLQGTFDPALGGAMDLTFDNLRLLEGVPAIPGDINNDDFVGVDDLNLVLVTWNNGTPPSSGGAAIPEPASLALLGLGGLAMLRRRLA